MQDYTPLGSTATTTVKDGILNHEKNINALRSTYSGTAFPTENLVAGLKCYRTDLGKTYTYNGKTWDDSVNTSSLTVSGETSVPTPATANNSKTIANTEFVHGVVSDLVNGAPTALDTLQELAAALGNDPNFATTILNKIGEKESKTDAQIEHKKLQNAIPTKVSQLSNDSGYQKTAEIPVVSQTQNGYMSKDDKVKLDGIAEGATNVTDYVQSVTELNGEMTVTKGSGESTTFNMNKALNDFIASRTLKAGDTVSIGDAIAAGYITTGGTSFRCTVPLNRISSTKLSGTLTGNCLLRQNGKYLIHTDYFNINSEFTYDRCIFNPCGHLDIWLHFAGSDKDINNNDTFAIQFDSLVFHANK